MFVAFGGIHLIFCTIFLLLIYLLIKKHEIFVKYNKITILCLLAIGPFLEFLYGVEKFHSGEFIYIAPRGLCQLALYLSTLLLFKYNRRIHVLTMTLSAGALISIIFSMTLNGQTIYSLRLYHFLLSHFFTVFTTIFLYFKHNFKFSIKDYKDGVIMALIALSLLEVSNLIIGIDELYFMSGPKGTPFGLIPAGIFRVVIGYIIYTIIFSIPFWTYRGYKFIFKRTSN